MRRESQRVTSWRGGQLVFAHAGAGEDSARTKLRRMARELGGSGDRGRGRDVQPVEIESAACLGQGSWLRSMQRRMGTICEERPHIYRAMRAMRLKKR